jgi:glutaredoxin
VHSYFFIFQYDNIKQAKMEANHYDKDEFTYYLMPNDEPTYRIYYRPGCQFCDKALQYMADNKILFEAYSMDYIEAEHDEIAKKLKEMHPTVPIIFIGSELVGGYDELLLKNGVAITE